MSSTAISKAMDEAVREGVFPGAVLLVGRGPDVLLEYAAGTLATRGLVADGLPPGLCERAMQPDVIFDLSSLTKPLATTVALFQLVAEGRCSLDEPVAAYARCLDRADKRRITFRQVLTHCAGLTWHLPLFRRAESEVGSGRLESLASRAAMDFCLQEIGAAPLDSAPGERMVYSDLGFIVLGRVIEDLRGEDLETVCRVRIFSRLGIDGIGFRPNGATARFPEAGQASAASRNALRAGCAGPWVAPTELCPWRGRVMLGEVHDENAWSMGGVAGHAGLFGTARAIHRLVATLLADAVAKPGQETLLPATQIGAMWTRDGTVQGSTRTLGWDTPAAHDSSAGTRMSRESVGHLGFTGTSLWLDRHNGIHVVLLSNRVHPSRQNVQIRCFRPKIHDLVMETFS